MSGSRLTSAWLTLALLALLVQGVACPAASAQASSPLPRMGLLSGSSEQANQESFRQMREGLRGHGLVEGRNLAIVPMLANGQLERLPALAASLVREKVDLIFAGGDAAIGAAKQATGSIPIVMVACDALAAGLVSNLSRPGGNLTGVTCVNSDLAAKRMELLREIMPGLGRLGLLASTGEKRVQQEVSESLASARRMNIGAVVLPVAQAEDFPRLMRQARQGGAGAIITVNDAFTFFHRRAIATAALQAGLPSMSNFSEYADVGALVTYGPSLPGMYRQAAAFVPRLLAGDAPGNLPVQQATRFDLVVNQATARVLKISIPNSVLLQANRIIE